MLSFGPNRKPEHDEGVPAMAKKDLDFTQEEVFAFHSKGRPGKLEIVPTKPLETQLDLSLAYSPGVSAPVRAISKAPDAAYAYTARGNLIAVISNGTAILGLGNLGALAAKPVMEGKSVLLKRFADIDAIDLEIDTQDPEAFINAVRYLTPSFGAINLEDIKAPDCFIVEDKLRSLMDIPVFHDDQHGTAVVVLAALINALELTGRTFNDTKVVINGAGAAGIACLELIKTMGLPNGNVLLCDTKGVIYKGRKEGMNPWKERHATETDKRTLFEACQGADVFIGLSSKGSLSEDMVRAMSKSPIIFALANPDPEMTPEEVSHIRDDAIVATGRSDYPNQVNNVLCFPYIFRGALDVRATTINDAMKIACAKSLAALARDGISYEVAHQLSHRRGVTFGPNYIIPFIFDPRLIREVPVAVAQAAQESGVARVKLDPKEYALQLGGRLNTASYVLQHVANKVRAQKSRRKVIFAEGEEALIVRSAIEFYDQGLGTPILVGPEDVIHQRLKEIGKEKYKNVIQIANARTWESTQDYVQMLYQRLQRQGYLRRDCVRLVHTDRNIFSSCILASGHADALITGTTRHYMNALDDITKMIDIQDGRCLMGISLIAMGETAIFVADTAVHKEPTPQQLAQIAIQSAQMAQKFGTVPRVAFIEESTFGNIPDGNRARVLEAMAILKNEGVDFEYDGELAASVALARNMKEHYPFCRLSDRANVLIMPSRQTALIATHLLTSLQQRSFVLGPILMGLGRSAQVVPMDASLSDIINMATVALYHPFLRQNLES